MSDFSVVTIVKGRRKQLNNLLQSIDRSSILPNDVQIVYMDEGNDIDFNTSLPIFIHSIKNKTILPLAAARNKGISSAKTDKVIVVDVDCIVSTTLFETMLCHLDSDRIISGIPKYLSIIPNDGIYERHLSEAVVHPNRQKLPIDISVNHLNFWSLIFAIEKKAFKTAGGFDEDFTGYGAEDTDFAMSFNAANIKLWFVKDYVLHQYHDKYDPPLNYFTDIVKNAQRYKEKWGSFPMQKWLKSFQLMKLISIEDNQITIQRLPTDKEIKHSLSKKPY